MKEHGFYLIKDEYIKLVNKLGGKYNDAKERPIYCCIKDDKVDGLYWLIPTSDLSHRTPEQIQKYKEYETYDDIRSAYYYVGKTTKPALYKISNALPISDKYILREFVSCNTHLILQDKAAITVIEERLKRILSYENVKPNKLEQHISDVKKYLVDELKALKIDKTNTSIKTPAPQPVPQKQSLKAMMSKAAQQKKDMAAATKSMEKWADDVQDIQQSRKNNIHR